MTTKTILIALLATTGIASAEDSDTDDNYGSRLVSGGLGLTLGGGVEGFTQSTLRDATQDGGNWSVRATFGTRLPIAVEGSYIGSAQRIDVAGLDSDALLVSNGVQGALRVNLTSNQPVQPFLYAGGAWRRYSLRSTRTAFEVADKDDIFEIPVGIGIGYRRDRLMLEARGEFRVAMAEDLLTDQNGEIASMHRYGVTANVGVEL